MSNEDNLKAALHYLISLPEHLEFYESYSSYQEIKSSDDMDAFFIAFQKHLSDNGTLNEQIELSIKFVKEQSDIVRHQKSTSPLFSISTSKKLNDSWIEDFRKEFSQCFTGDVFAEKIKPRQYKTIKENLIVHSVSSEMLLALNEKYSQFNHPFVNYQIASVIYNSKNFSQGLPILRKGISTVCSYPHYYWNNEYAIEGAAWMIGDFLYLLGQDIFQKEELHKEKIKLLKLLFLYVSRYISMTKSNLKCIDFYSNRARIVRGNYIDFVGIFSSGVNPDIQFISDMYLAYQTAINNEMPIIQPIQQLYWDSMKMYRHGSLIPNSSGGYQEIEDRTWMELVRDGEVRSIMLANKLLKEFENHELNISKLTITILFDYLIETKQDDMKNYLDKLNERKLKSSGSTSDEKHGS